MNFEESDNDNKSEKSKGIEFYRKQQNTSDDWNMGNSSSLNNQNGYPK